MKKTLKEVYPTFDSIKTLLFNIQSAVGDDDDGNPILWPDFSEDSLEEMTLQYYVGRTKRIVTTLVNYLNESSELSSLPEHIAKRFSDNWIRVYNAYFKSDYNPLDNYAMHETRTPDLTEQIDASANSKSKSTTSSGVYGFNSSESVPTADSESNTEALEDDNYSASTKKNTGTETIHRTGNIGVKMSQEMLRAEIEVRSYDYWKMVFDDLDSLLLRGMIC
ncbi:hypothetical protein IJ380_03985 [Candidatus Saccharibacteria bacterium]|nr:hypothetical protein [Candidatus Saccharibacteria bacterium]